ncbi:DUF2851 family protein [Bacteroidota bacterium]
MGGRPRVLEKQLYDVWKNQNYTKVLITISGEEVAILDVGAENIETGGPDFKNARIRIGNLTYVGDIEIDPDYKDWKSHGHNIDGKYNKVILHASLTNKFNQPYVYTKDGRKVPTICLGEYIGDGILDKIKTRAGVNKIRTDSQLRCSGAISDVDENVKEKFLSDLGIARFKKKCQKLYQRLKELKYIQELGIKEPVISYDLKPEFNERKFSYDDFKDKALWQQLFYEYVFEALGYSKNKGIMLNLSRAANVGFINQLGNKEQVLGKIETSLFHISGIMQKAADAKDTEIIEYVNSLKNNWSEIKDIYDGKTFNETQWHFFKLRPQNFPTIRLAAGARILNQLLNKDLIGVITKKITEIRNPKVLINSLRSLFVIKSEGFWSKHYVFNQSSKTGIKYFIGAARADEIIINVILPVFAVYFEIFGNKDLAKKIFKVYGIYDQKSDNKIVRDVADSLGMDEQLKKTIYSQGMIELFRNYCSKNKCLECEIGKLVFT